MTEHITLRKLPSDKYFQTITTQEQLAKLIGTGMLYEVELYAPSYWKEHLKLKAEWERRKLEGVS